MARLTPKMLSLMQERELADEQALSEYLGRCVAADGLRQTARAVGISVASLNTWLLRLNIQIDRRPVVRVGGKKLKEA